MVQNCEFSNGSIIFISLDETEKPEDLQPFLASLGITEMTLPLPSGPVSLNGHRIFLLSPENSVFFTGCRFTNVPIYSFTNNNRLSLQRELREQLGAGALPSTSEAEEKDFALRQSLTSSVAFSVNFFNNKAAIQEGNQFIMEESLNVLLGSTLAIPENCCQDVKDLADNLWPCSRRAEITFKGCNFLNSAVALKFSRFLVITDEVLAEMRRLSALVSAQQPDPLQLALDQEPLVLSLRQQPIADMIMKSGFFSTEGERSAVSYLSCSGIRDLIGGYADEHTLLARRMREANNVTVPYVSNLAVFINGTTGIPLNLCILVVNYLYRTGHSLNISSFDISSFEIKHAQTTFPPPPLFP